MTPAPMTLADAAAGLGPGQLVAMIGHPVTQTKLPDHFNRHASEVGSGRQMTRIDVAPDDLASFVSEVRAEQVVAGFVSTIPHKARLAGLVDDTSERVRLTGVCNAVRRDASGRLLGDMLDGLAMCDAIEAAGVELHGASVTIAGCGAAGRAIALELSHRAVGRLELRDQDTRTAEATAGSLRELAPAVEVVVAGTGAGRGSILVNASPAGMYDDSVPFEPVEMNGARVVADAVTGRLTPLLAAAADRRCVTIDGTAMAAAQLEPLLRLLAPQRGTSTERR